MQHTESTAALAAALAKAQGEMEAAARDGKNPHFRSSYASLASAFRAIQEPLARNGLGISQHPETEHDEGGHAFVRVTTVLLHDSGERLSSSMSLPLEQTKGVTLAQAAGSLISYLRRYALMAIVGLPADDDDGNTAGPAAEQQGRVRTGHPTEGQSRMFYALTRKLGMDDEDIARGLEHHGHSCKFSELTVTQASQILDALKIKADKVDAKSKNATPEQEATDE